MPAPSTHAFLSDTQIAAVFNVLLGMSPREVDIQVVRLMGRRRIILLNISGTTGSANPMNRPSSASSRKSTAYLQTTQAKFAHTATLECLLARWPAASTMQ